MLSNALLEEWNSAFSGGAWLSFRREKVPGILGGLVLRSAVGRECPSRALLGPNGREEPKRECAQQRRERHVRSKPITVFPQRASDLVLRSAGGRNPLHSGHLQEILEDIPVVLSSLQAP